MDRYSQDLVVAIDDFRRSGWKTVITSCEREGYDSMWLSLSAAARQAIDEGRASEGKVLWLLADACSMMLHPTSPNEPFGPIMVMSGRRSALPEDFQQSDIDFFSLIVEEVDDIWLRARLADLLWLLEKPRKGEHALLAIDAYRRVPLDVATWTRGGRECWERAISLARMLRAGAGDRLKALEVAITAAFDAEENDDELLPLWLAELLAASRLGRGNEVAIAGRLESLGRRFDSKSNLSSARECFAAAGEWFDRAGDRAKVTEMTVLHAEGWAKEAVAQTSTARPSYMLAASFYEKAIQTYRSIPRRERAPYGVDNRIAELHARLSDAGERSWEEMGIVATPTIDITEAVERTRSAIRGKPLSEAMAAFVNIYPGIQVSKLRENARRMLQEHPLMALLSATHISKDGRVIARRPGFLEDAEGDDDTNVTIRAEMVKNYGIEIGLAVQAAIWPAFEVLILEHRMRESDFLAITRRSPIVPVGRERIFAKALFAGYEMDFVVALHLLVPQIEQMVRWHLKARGVKTTNLDKDGLEYENGLSALMELREVTSIFGEDTAFEVKALFCDAFGPNFRNEIAHGLLDVEECESPLAIYAWWLGFKLVFRTFWNAEKGRVDAPESGSAEVPAG